MPYKYIGRTIDLRGKSLWEIIGNLKNLGVGRIVARNRMECYPEPSYMKILKVETLPNPETVTPDNIRKVRVWMEKTFRGKTYPKPVIIESASYKPDYKLIAKDDEAEYCKKDQYNRTEQKIVLPRTGEFPPLMKELILRDAKSRGENPVEELKLELVYNRKSKKAKYHIAEDGEEPNTPVAVGLGTPISPSLYKGIQLK